MVKQAFIDALEAVGYVVYQENALPPEVPSTYVTFHVADTYDIAWLNDLRMLTQWTFELKLFSTDPVVLEEDKRKIRDVLEAVGFKTDGLGWDILPSDEDNRLGWDCDFLYIEHVREI
ncbi:MULTISPECIES: hypothetical protein [Bacteria]|uniref:Uncharacterized protein n=1 Tax=Cellulomonas carbonis T26 TaxID=947969 RepID=A0A0A0BLP3_9CELL|nr:MULTISPECIES: hypothetical protein [Bacteria]KGM09448.1 hypothetical protein N868_02110 [Cellulomonas carbonis T26]KSV94658.1 hypothetical protein N184_36460 [Sinorhizobium sp. GL28]